jgi:uridylate kinase
MAYKRVLLKVSGEGFNAQGRQGIDVADVSMLASSIVEVHKGGVQLAVVVGAGNLVRGRDLARTGVNRETADYMGMIATVLNALALQDQIERVHGVETRVMTSIEMGEVAEPYIRRRAIRHLEKGRIVVLAAGTGNPHFSTDTAAALRAAEIRAEVLLKATRVDGVFTADPEADPNVEKFESLSYIDVITRKLGVMDMTAVTLCMEKNIPIIVFSMRKKGNILKAVRGEKVGTMIAQP